MGEKTNTGQAEELLKSSSRTESSRQKLLTVLERLRMSEAVILSRDARREVDTLYRKFQESQFYLVFLGQFKRGKTTLINAFVGEDLLPTGVLPLTSIVTVVRFGVEREARVKFADGSSRKIRLGEISEYVTERGNPKNRKDVAQVEVLYPSDRLRDGLCLVDTPGIGSIFEHNTQVAYNFVPRSDAAIFVFSPESPLSQPELHFLRHLRTHVEKIFFVLNKADQVSFEERDEILEFARNAIREQIPAGELRLFSVSGRQGLAALQILDNASLDASGFPLLSAAVDQFLASHGRDLLLRTTCAALRGVVKEELLAYELEKHALYLSSAEIEEKIGRIQQAWEALDQRHREAGYILRGESRALESDLEKELNQFVEAEAPRLAGHMEQKLRGSRQASKRELVKALEEEVANQIADIFEDWRIKEEKALAEAFERLTSRFSLEAAETIHQIQRAATDQFGFTWAPTPLPDRFMTESRFSLRLEYLMSWGLGQFPFLLPMRWFRRFLGGTLHDACAQELYRHAGRLKTDLGDRLEQSVSGYIRALDEHVEAARKPVLAALQRAVATKQAEERKTEKVLSERSSLPPLLRELDDELSTLQTGWANHPKGWGTSMRS
jgi:GTPase SAR1 family protein